MPPANIQKINESLSMAHHAYQIQHNTELFFASQINNKSLDLELREMYLNNVWGFAEAAKVNFQEYQRLKKYYESRYPHLVNQFIKI